jgi:hypothetical protein
MLPPVLPNQAHFASTIGLLFYGNGYERVPRGLVYRSPVAMLAVADQIENFHS